MTNRILAACVVSAALALPAPALAQDEEQKAIDTAFAHFTQTFADTCFWFANDYLEEHDIGTWDLSWQPKYADTAYETTLFEFFCGAGAYNISSVFYLVDPYEGPFPVAFAVPHFDLKYENDDFDGAVESITVTGMTSQWRLTNAHFDPETETIVSNAYWRGLGDASSIGVWQFHDGNFILKTYDVDATYDGEVDHERIVEYK